MNFTSVALANETPKIQRTDDAPQQGVGAAPRPKSWSYMHRIKWARALPVKPGARLTAVAICDHINERSGSWVLSAARLADETGQGERTVRRHINEELRAHFHVEDRPGRMWRFTIPAPMMAVVDPRPNRPDPPAKSAGVPSDLPSKKESPLALPDHLEAIEGGHGLKCRRCDHSWPAVKGRAHLCVSWREKTHRTRGGRVRPQRDSDVRSRKIDQARRKWKRIESIPK